MKKVQFQVRDVPKKINDRRKFFAKNIGGFQRGRAQSCPQTMGIVVGVWKNFLCQALAKDTAQGGGLWGGVRPARDV